MNRRLTSDAFTYYVSLGPARSYQAVAEKYGVTKRAVTKAAAREDWAKRIAAIEEEARKTTDAKLAGDLAEMNLRHRKILTAMAARAAKALQEFPLTNGMDGIKAAALVIKMERLLAGEPTDRSAVDIEEVTRRELKELLVVRAGGADTEGEDDDDDE